MSLFYFNSTRLMDMADRLAPEYRAASPFPHVVIDDFLPGAVIDEVLGEFPAPEALDWVQYNGSAEKKLASRDESQLGPVTRHTLQQFNSSAFCVFLERLTGIDGVVPDPHFWGGGLHQIERGGFLKVHSDFNWYGKLKLDRRLNVLLYLNRDWEEAFGGHLELWSSDMSRCERRVLPIANRCVIFSTGNSSFHGHPEPLACPEGQTRKSLALYYYSNGRSEGERTWSTGFRRRPGEQFDTGESSSRVREALRRLTPPIILDWLRSGERER
ncbi:MAG TPA: 2OG-Fe(II) oxygenase [Terriglobia bacterium]|nr:2OG-Fe(II) oxygenase [Terriglobia bacterium]